MIKAFDVLSEYYSKKGEIEQTKFDTSGSGASVTFTKKVEILKNNIFGVDLDSKAVEIAQLNLLMKIAEKSQRLPLLQENIKCGNSLIDDQTIAGDKAFKWEEQFKEIMDEGGFDVVIGNPPYVNVYLMDGQERKFFNESNVYKTPHLKYDLYTLFIERGISLLIVNLINN